MAGDPMRGVRSSDGVEIAVWSSGSGPALVLVHGTAADHSRWDAVRSELGVHFTVYTMDRRGRGESGDAEPYRMEAEFDDVAAVVDSIGRDVVVLGHSYGGFCALEAARRTSGIAKLLLYEPPVGGAIAPDEAWLAKAQDGIDRGEREAVLASFFTDIVGVPADQLSTLRELPVWQARLNAVRTIPREFRATVAYQSSNDGLLNRGLGADVLLSVQRLVGWPAGLMSSQFSDDRSERVGEVGAEDEVGEADLLPSPLDLLGGRRRVIRKYRQGVRRAKRTRVGVGGRHKRRDSVADHRHVEREFDVPDGAKVAYQPRDFDPRLTRQQCEGDRICELGRQRLGLRPAHGHHHRRVKVGAVEISKRRHGLTHLGQPLARWYDGQSQFAEFVFDPRPAGADAHLEATVSEHRQRVRFPRGAPSRAQRGGIHPSPHPQVGKAGRDGKRGARRRLPLRDIGHQKRRVAAVGDSAHPISPRRQISCERGNDPESERSGSASCRRVGHRSCSFVSSRSPSRGSLLTGHVALAQDGRGRSVRIAQVGLR
jgi:pimeloyl-ACP methyl ester carboxylesterase